MQLILGLWLIYSTHANAEYREMIWDTREKSWLTLEQVQARSADEIFVIGEEHAVPDNANESQTIAHHRNQVRLMEQLRKHHRLSVGMEFIAYPYQSETDQFVDGQLSEADFVKSVEWGTNPFALYRDQILASKNSGRTLALNAPRSLARRVGQVGPNGLNEAERALLPPIWEQGRAEYFARFREAMGGHVPEEKLVNYFWAQSLWDDTMAWKALARPQDSVLAIVVGYFHAEFGHGLPSRLRRLGAKNVTTVIQVQVEEFTEESRLEAISPDPQYGERADLIWVYSL